MSTASFKTKSDRDRLRQQRGESRKQQMREIRRIVQSWNDGADAEASMQRIDDVCRDVKARG